MAKKLSLLLLPLLLGLASDTLWGWHWFEPAARRNQKGIAAYRQEKYAAALEQFLSAKGLRPDAQPLKNNTAAALYQLKKFQEAADEFSSIDPARLGKDQAGLHYNLGNAQYRLGQFPKALESYKRSLLLAPDDVQCKKNFELTLKRIREQQPQPQQQQPDNQAQAEQQKQKYEAMMQFLNQNEKQQMEKKKRKAKPARNEKDW
ncbi:MAG: tetratricopeptide repeat protein [Acidobacteria bacterium]|jgi:tetratricopeptide (TPR) repeat protein|nr:tetratricopeptide repeat protein [Acidobacteriota bacterium]